ncbi:hypothetical protein BJX68DRAFT_263375 [Aspergillus pseudodeflectus]|uniref:Pyridoxamine 5'-phosphate oxidase Alr4036 family FMN-binding domain-containing protein n=1 Tax=Aspergillus pseudodeflectus TaxID=176178 RepID=A0ABR4L060_9EURO
MPLLEDKERATVWVVAQVTDEMKRKPPTHLTEKVFSILIYLPTTHKTTLPLFYPGTTHRNIPKWHQPSPSPRNTATTAPASTCASSTAKPSSPEFSCNQGTPEEAAAAEDAEPWWGFAEKGAAGGLLMQRGTIEQIFHFNSFVLAEPRGDTEADRAAFRVATLRDVQDFWTEDQTFDETARTPPSEGGVVRGFWMDRAPDIARAGEGCKIPLLRVGFGRVTDVVEKYAFCLVFPVTGDGVAGWFTRQGFRIPLMQ